MNVNCMYNRVMVRDGGTVVESDTLSAPFFAGARIRRGAVRRPTAMTLSWKVSEADRDPYFVCNQQVMMLWWLDLDGGNSND